MEKIQQKSHDKNLENYVCFRIAKIIYYLCYLLLIFLLVVGVFTFGKTYHSSADRDPVEIGLEVKKTFPVYQDLTDFELGRRVLEKYPYQTEIGEIKLRNQGYYTWNIMNLLIRLAVVIVFYLLVLEVTRRIVLYIALGRNWKQRLKNG